MNQSTTKNKGNDSHEIISGGHSIQLTHLDKEYWPEEKVTKGDLIDYYQRVSKYILPYLKDRPESLKRNPNGILDKGFFQKNAGPDAPDWVKRVGIHSESTDRETQYIICNDPATLSYLNNLGCVEINPWNSRTQNLDNPDYMIIDIDPADKNSFNDVIDATLAVKEVLDRAKVTGYCKTSGASGMHIYIPLKAAYPYEQIRPFAQCIAELTHQALPKTTTLERSLVKRKGKIYLDYLQNSRGQTLASVYSVRPVSGACVSTPLDWKEVRHGLDPLEFTMSTIEKRLSKVGDIFKGVLTGKTDIEKAMDKVMT